MKKKKEISNLVTTVTFLNRDQVDYLDRMGKDCFFKYGHKLPRTKILFELVNLLMELNLNYNEMDLTQETLSEGILKLIQRHYYTQTFSFKDLTTPVKEESQMSFEQKQKVKKLKDEDEKNL